MRVTRGVVSGFLGLAGPRTSGPRTGDSSSGLVDSKASTEGLYVGRTTLGWIVTHRVFSWVGFCDSVVWKVMLFAAQSIDGLYWVSQQYPSTIVQFESRGI